VVLHYVAGILTALLGIGITIVGVQYLVAPESTARSFGLSAWPSGEVLAWCNIKGARDLGMGLVTFVILGTAPWHVVGWFVLAAAVIPIGDALTVLRYKGSKVLAYAMHGGTAAAMVVTALLLVLS
jgi:hypothetical protein